MADLPKHDLIQRPMAPPSVVCVMLANGRPGMVQRAVESFRAQTYDPCRRLLLVFDSGTPRNLQSASDSENEVWQPAPGWENKSFGALRNGANKLAAAYGAEILCHWDSDDWSHPQRIKEQVALLCSSGKECVGYNQMLFWDTRGVEMVHTTHPQAKCPRRELVAMNEAWLFTNRDPRYVLDTSACYLRAWWEKVPFPEGAGNVDTLRWIHNADSYCGVSSLRENGAVDPRMIAAIHEGNRANPAYKNRDKNTTWQRVPEWDAHCKGTM